VAGDLDGTVDAWDSALSGVCGWHSYG
jgi:hypothetical protein